MITTAQAVPGRKVSVASFEATIVNVEVSGADYCTEVLDDAGVTHFIYQTRLNPVYPYRDGQLYAANDGAGLVYSYVAGKDGSEGTWRNRKGDGTLMEVPRAFGYPPRPLRPVTLGPGLTD
jgi:hypothetical protein